MKSFSLLTAKPMMFVANISDVDLTNSTHSMVDDLKNYLTNNKIMIQVSGALEMEISNLNSNEQKEFLSEFGVIESGLNKIIRSAYKILDLKTFFTATPKEIRAWSIKKGARAPEAAGAIHSDFERGFIKAEIYNIVDLINYKSESKIKEAGKLRQEGKLYQVRDGDIIFFKFNV